MDPAVQRLIRDRHGVVTRAELCALGLTESRIYRQVAAGQWRSAGKGVLVHVSAPNGLLTASLVASLRVPTAMLTGPSAAMLRPHPAWGGQRLAGQRPMLIARRHDGSPFRSVRHPGAVAAPHPLGIRVADLHTTLVDLIRYLPWRDAAAVAAKAVGLQLTSVAALESSVAALASAHGAVRLRRITEGLRRGAESGPEIDVHLKLRKAGIRGWVANPTLEIDGHSFRPDIYFPRQDVAIEYDGYDDHSGKAPFAYDRMRGNSFAFEDRCALHLTKETLYDRAEWAAFVGKLKALLRRRGNPGDQRGPR